jgi:cation:H+ antiporter
MDYYQAMENLSLMLLVVVFILAGVITWGAGIALTKTTSTLDTRYKIGDALGGLILLGIAGSLPEIAVVYSAAMAGRTPVIIGNLIGGLSIQTLIIVIFDFAVNKRKPLSYLSGSPLMSLEAVTAMGVTLIAIFGMIFPAKFTIAHISPFSIGIAVAWVLGLLMINKERKLQRFNKTPQDAMPGRKHHERRAVENHPFFANRSNIYVLAIFALASIATLIAGVFLERAGSSIAGRLGIGSGIFAATAIAFVTSLPEISTGLESIFIGDNQLAISDIMGGNAFMLALFLFADLVAGKPVLSFAGHADILLGVLAAVMMGIYAISFVSKMKKCYFRLGVDSYIEIALYAIGISLLTKL